MATCEPWLLARQPPSRVCHRVCPHRPAGDKPACHIAGCHPAQPRCGVTTPVWGDNPSVG